MLRLEQRLVPFQIAAIILVALFSLGSRQLAYSRLPAPIRETITARYSDAGFVRCHTESENGVTLHEVTLRHAGQLVDVTFSSDGQVIEEERLISTRLLPRQVKQSLARVATNTKIVKVEEVWRDGFNGYEVCLEDGHAIQRMICDLNGQWLEHD